jgi:hypothetical protein
VDGHGLGRWRFAAAPVFRKVVRKENGAAIDAKAGVQNPFAVIGKVLKLDRGAERPTLKVERRLASLHGQIGIDADRDC